MIQTILLFTLRPGVTDEQVEALRAGFGRSRSKAATAGPGSGDTAACRMRGC
jgi:hypothetical protein